MRRLYMLHGRAVAQQEDTPSAINYPSGRVFLHGDHLGSVSVVTDNDRRVLSRQDYTPWGEARGGDISQTTLDFTGQRKDGTGLLYYGARYYDPKLGRFLSPDSIVPDGSKAALRPLTVDFHEVSFVVGIAQEDTFTQLKGFAFQVNDQDRRKAKLDTGPGDPQALNRYTYVLNNPLLHIDPSGHDAETIFKVLAAAIVGLLSVAALEALAPEAIAVLAVALEAVGEFTALACLASSFCLNAALGVFGDAGYPTEDNQVFAFRLVKVIEGCLFVACGEQLAKRGIKLSAHGAAALVDRILKGQLSEASVIAAYFNGQVYPNGDDRTKKYVRSTGTVVIINPDGSIGTVFYSPDPPSRSRYSIGHAIAWDNGIHP